MKSRLTTTRFALVLLAAATLTVSVSATEKKGDLHAVKECSQYNQMPGGFCTFIRSDFALIQPGTRVYYDQAPGIPAGLLDSNVVLDAGAGNRALGRCTLDQATGKGLCTFSDGTGQFAGFQARLEVSFAGGANFRWDGTYSFDHDRDRR